MGELDPDLSDASLEKENLGLELTKTSSNVMRNPRQPYTFCWTFCMYRKYQLVIFLFFSGWSFCYACYSSRVSSHMSNSVVSQGVLTSGISGVGELYSCSTKTIVLSSVVVTEVASGSSCRAHTDFTWTPSKKDGMHTQKEGQCQVCWKLLIWRKAWCEMLG
jgi:hypothetical protein